MRKLLNLHKLDDSNLIPVKNALQQSQYDQANRLLKDYYIRRQSPKLYGNDMAKEDAVIFLNDHFAEETDRVINAADQIVLQTFVFQEAWDMEKTRVPVTFHKGIDWSYIPFHDPEWAYMLNRHRFFIVLGRAYALTKDEKYAKAFCDMLLDWIDSTIKKSSLTWRTIDTGLRISNWVEAFYYFQNSIHFTSELFSKMLFSLYEQGKWLENNFTNWDSISNWGVIESKGLFELSLFASTFKEAGEWQRLSLERLKKTTHLQVMKDGIHWEQSPMYHNEVLLCYLDVVYFSKKNNIKLDKSIVGATRKMAFANLHMAKPNHHQPMKGDSDSFDLRDVITKSAIIFQDPFLKFGGYTTIDFDNLWVFGMEEGAFYNNLSKMKPKEASRGFEYSGNYIMRSGWDKNDLYLYFHCGQLGGGHGHADLLHFDVHAYGKDLLTDAGRYNYSSAYPLRKELKKATTHNTTIVDAIDFTEFTDSWGVQRVATPMGTRWIQERQFDYVEGAHNGYFYFDDPVLVKRRIIFVKPYYWFLVDEFECKDEHTFVQNFHFPPGEIVLNQATKICSTQNKDEANIHLIPIQPDLLTVGIMESKISYEYNVVERNKNIQYELKSSGSSAMMQLIFPSKAGEHSVPTVSKMDVYDLSGKVVSQKDAQACKILLPNLGEEHLLLICFKKPYQHNMSYMIDGTQVFGEIILIKRKDGEEEVVTIL